VHRAPPLGDAECWVPAGWAVVGADEQAPDAFPRRRVWVDAFVMGRYPVTNAEYLAFLREAGDDRWVPRSTDFGEPLIPPESAADCPVTHVDLACARAYARWRAERDGLPWRLPTELEWEKAARGVDGRQWPWGDHFEPAWARTVSSLPVPGLGPVSTFPDDESVYGVRGLAGAVRDWTASAWSPAPPADGSRAPVHDQTGEHQIVRGGAWTSSAPHCRPAARFGGAPTGRYSNTGFRLVRSV
jgi:serine/threonine-protein kinase